MSYLSSSALIEDSSTRRAMIGSGAVTVSLLLSCIYYVPSYLKAFKRNLEAHQVSPLFLLMSYNHGALKYHYTGFLGFGIACIIYSLLFGTLSYWDYSAFTFILLGFTLVMYTFSYQVIISVISIHRFINSRQSEELRGTLTRKNVKFITLLVAFLVIIKDIACVVWIVILWIHYRVSGDVLNQKIVLVLVYYYLIYVGQQVLLIIAMIMEFTIRETKVSHSEHILVMHTLYLGGIKAILAAICFLCFLFHQYTDVAMSIFFGIDFFLVPLVIELTEIQEKPKIVTPGVSRMFSSGV